MQTDKITVKNDGVGMEEALEEAVKFSEYEGLDHKQALKVRLLAEETLGMVGAITGNFKAEFWIESDKKCAVRICLSARTLMDYAKRRELLDMASDKKNLASKGFMGKIRQMIENGLYAIDESGSIPNDMDGLHYVNMGLAGVEPGGGITPVSYRWSLKNYRESVEKTKAEESWAVEARDELEKSIVAKLSDDVFVGVRGDNIELVIEKRSF